MDRDRFAEIERVCQAALDRPPEERSAFLDAACKDDTGLRAEVESLLDEASGTGSPSGGVVAPPAAATLNAGQRLGPYEVVGRVGAGGMGEVYKARDTRLDRVVAIKILPTTLGADPDRRARFARERKIIAELNHPHICSVYDIGREGESDFLVMEYVEGSRIAAPCPPATALGYAIQIADALRASHDKGIVHRDLKPANVMVTADGRVKVLDFGLAKHVDGAVEVGPEAPTEAVPEGEPSITRNGAAMGTLSYMSPEQVEGTPLDARTDIFSFGALFHEILTGQKAFGGGSATATLASILHDTPVPVARLRPGIPPGLQAILDRCLQKDREARYGSAGELHEELVRCQAALLGRTSGWRSLLRPRVMVPVALILVATIAVGAWQAYRASRARWARSVALPEIARLAAAGPNARAFVLAREAIRYLSDDPALREWLSSLARPASLIHTAPAGALVEWKDYSASDDAPWETVGTTEFKRGIVPNAFVRWRISNDGYDPLEVAFSLFSGEKTLVLAPKGSTPPGMVFVAGHEYQRGVGPRVELADYFLDKYEVTNRKFKEFVDAGGYRTRDFWKHPIVKDGRDLGWERAMTEFRDSTGQNGPSTWAYGSYPDGQADYPVGGVSWYEAAAYAEFRGKSLPTIHHWQYAADVGIFSDIHLLSNFGPTPAPAGKFRGLAPSGACDLAGNVKEWCATSAAEGDSRYIVGGGFGEAAHMFEVQDAEPPMRRLPNYGFRCAKYPRPIPEEQIAPVGVQRRDYRTEKPVDDKTFEVWRGMYAYDRTSLHETLESVDDSREYWSKEKITFDAAYGRGNERVIAYLYLPRNSVPPYQVVVFFPPAVAVRLRSSANLPTQYFQGFLRAGRAVLYPVYEGQFERGTGQLANPGSDRRDRMVHIYRDLGRSLDYLETRSDVDATKVAFFGTSMGVSGGIIPLALEPRIRASLLVSGGLLSSRSAPETDTLNFAPRVKVPTLLIGGRYDFMFPVESSQNPLFELLGAPRDKKKHWILENAGHIPNADDMREVDRLMLEWLNTYLGPVRTR
jgi:eukaryotic-like serine/threonine-protein kinase